MGSREVSRTTVTLVLPDRSVAIPSVGVPGRMIPSKAS